MQKEILVAVDGSVYSNQSLSYLSPLFADQPDIHFYLCTWITASASVMPSVADSKNSLIPTGGGQTKKEATANRYLNKATEKLTRAEAAPIVKALTEKYKGGMTAEEKPIGKPFDQLYDVDKVVPLPEWQSIYEEVSLEFETEFGLKL